MRLQMFLEVIAAHESLAAESAEELLVSGMSLQMSLQLVGARETLPTEQPTTAERAVTHVPPEVCPQM